MLQSVGSQRIRHDWAPEQQYPEYRKKSHNIIIIFFKLEPIIQSEVSQKEKHQYSILTHIYGI